MENEITGDSLFFTTSYRIMGACRTRRLFFLELGQLGLGISKIPTIVTLKLSKEPLLVLFFGLSWRDQRKAKRSALLLLVKIVYEPDGEPKAFVCFANPGNSGSLISTSSNKNFLSLSCCFILNDWPYGSDVNTRRFGYATCDQAVSRLLELIQFLDFKTLESDQWTQA